MSVTVILEVTVKAGMANDFLALCAAQLPDTRTYEGCLGVQMCQSQEDGDKFSAIETWESNEHQQAYFAWRTEIGDVDKTMALLNDIAITYYNNADV